MTSMIDVVFLLLIFFVASSQFRPTERNLDPTIEFRRAAAAEKASELEPIVIEVFEDQGVAAFRLGGRTCSTATDLVQVLAALPSRENGVFVRVADRVPFGAAAEVIQICRSTGFSLVSYVPADES